MGEDIDIAHEMMTWDIPPGDYNAKPEHFFLACNLMFTAQWCEATAGVVLDEQELQVFPIH